MLHDTVPHSRAPKLAHVKISGTAGGAGAEKLALVLLPLVSVLHLGNHSTTRRETAPANIHLKVRFPRYLGILSARGDPNPTVLAEGS